ncbi:MAG TPA: putative baseplate assembly protein [Thermomicrobiales bacterium]|nr:putative baseplate assembly protein [Thermomicrobiales bacterium]
MNETCGCCAGVARLTPLATANRPGLDALAYRVGTHASFLATMLAGLADAAADTSLAGLTAREPGDPAIALLDAWATVADVLTFYQERIANEGYLRTATESRSVLELARLVGYAPRPGVAASVYLAYSLEQGGALTIPKGSRAQSVPGPGETLQSFETAEPLEARAAWNALRPRRTRPQWISPQNPTPLTALYFDGLATNLRPNDALLFDFADRQYLGHVATVEPRAQDQRTEVTLQAAPWGDAAPAGGDGAARPASVLRADGIGAGAGGDGTSPYAYLGEAFARLELPPSQPPPNALRLARQTRQVYAPQSDTSVQLLQALNRRLAPVLYSALANATVTPPAALQDVSALRVKAAPFGHNAPLKPIYDENGRVDHWEEWPLGDTASVGLRLSAASPLTGAFYRDALQVELMVELGGARQSATVQLLVDQEPTAPASPNVTIAQETAVEGELNAAYRRGLTFTFQNPRATIAIVPEPNDGQHEQLTALHLTLDGDPDRRVPVGGNRLSEQTGGRTISITLDDALTVAEALTTPADPHVVSLDAQYDQVVPGGWVVIERGQAAAPQHFFYTVRQTRTVSRAEYGITGKVTELTLAPGPANAGDWLDADEHSLAALRETTIYAQSEPLALAEEPIVGPGDAAAEVAGGVDDPLELDGLYDGLKAGRWLIVSGERTDVPGTSGVPASELVMLAGVEQDVQKVVPVGAEAAGAIPLPGDKTHTFLTLATPLAYRYRLTTVTINANVARATHGESRAEVLGSGDGGASLAAFTLRQPPLTYVSAPTPAGAASTLAVRVDGVLWREADSLASLGPTDRRYITRTDDAGKTTVVFGNGSRGARPPTGVENITASYRSGIGVPGNVGAGRITLLASKPLGVRGVTNPLPATGGADREGRDQARRNAPLAVTALDRLVAVPDYADFARTFAGVAKADAARLSDGRRQLVHLTAAGVAGAALDPTGDLLRNLRLALVRAGDPALPVQVAPCAARLLVIAARVRPLADYQWEGIAPAVRAALLDAFGFDRRDLGQGVLLSEVVAAIQAVAGVARVRMETLDALGEADVRDRLAGGEGLAGALHLRLCVTARRAAPPARAGEPIQPAELVYLSPDVPDTLLLTEDTDGPPA